VTRFFLAVAVALMLGSCSDRFGAPPLPDLHKDPYDFAVDVPPYTGPTADLSATVPRDLAHDEPRDFAMPGPPGD
jgi:hypothetical protein